MVCFVTFGGGLIGGDSLELDLHVAEGATLVVFTQATTKVFRGASTQCTRAVVHGTLVLLPDPVACFRASSFTQRVDITLCGRGSVVALDGFTSGRPAFGDRWAFEALDAALVGANLVTMARDALRVREGGPVVFARCNIGDGVDTIAAHILSARADALAPAC